MRFFVIISFIFVSTSFAQYAYKKIIMTSCVSKKSAVDYLYELSHDRKNSALLAERERYGFDFVIKRSGRYYIVSAEPLENQKAVEQILPLIKKLQPDAYVKPTYRKTAVSFKHKSKQSLLFNVEKESTSPENIGRQSEECPVVTEEQAQEAVTTDTVEKVTESVSEAAVSPEENSSTETEGIREVVFAGQVDARAEKDEKEQALIQNSDTFPDAAYWVIIALLFSFVSYQHYRLSDYFSGLRKSEALCEAKTKAKDEFLAKMSHEIRTPMHAIMGFSHLLRETMLSAHQSEYLQKVQNSTELLLNIINDILDFSKIEAGKLDIEMVEFNINMMLESISNLITIKANQKGLELIFDIDNNVPSKLVGDPLRIQQILTNLFSNAVKFTEKGEISLKVKQLPSEGEDIIVEFEVTDTGIGLTEVQQSKLFRSYHQADISTSREYGGTGLGLTISKQLVELMGGEISVKSEYGKGSVFTFHVVMATPEVVEQRKYRLPSKSLMDKKVLIIDEHTKSAEALMQMLLYYHYRSDIVETEEDALDLLREKTYDIIFIASEYVAHNRKDAVQKYKELSSGKVVLLESDLDIITTFLNRHLPVDATLYKPFTQQNVLRTITSLYIEQEESKQHKFTKADLKQLRGGKILLAEDNKINQGIIFGLLEGSGIEIVVAENGKEAVEYLQSGNEADLVLMDINMPVMDGYEATEVILADEKYRHIPIVALTASALNSDAQKIKKAGMQQHLSKPLDVSVFYATLFQYLSLKEQENGADGAARKTGKDDLKMLMKMENLNARDGLEMAKGDIDLYKSVLSEFSKWYYDSAKRFAVLAHNGEWAQGEKISREIKELSESIGAHALAETATKLEEAFSQKVKRDYEPLLDAYKKALIGVVYSIEFVL